MKTVTQYKDDIKRLMDSCASMDAQAITEARDLTNEELILKNEMMDEVGRVRVIVSTLERQERLAGSLDAPVQHAQTATGAMPEGTIVVRDQDRFHTLGEQLAAVYRAGQPGGRVDPRLLNTRTASGLNIDVPSDGGFLVQQDFSTDLLQQTFATGVLASRCRRIQISSNANSVKINGVDETSRVSTRYGGILAYWEDEADEKIKSKPKFRKIELNLKKLTGLCYMTDELLTDAAALESFIRSSFVGEFGFQLDDSIVNGNGTNQPLGILNAGSLVTVSKEAGQAAGTVQAENVIKMYSRIFATSRSNAVWLINQNVEPQLFTMTLTVGTAGVPVYMPAGGLSGLPYGTLFGRPVIPIEQAASVGTVGDIIFADLADGYILAEKGGMKADMSIHVRFVYDESVFRFVMRVDGQTVRASALTPYKGGASYTQSHFIALESR